MPANKTNKTKNQQIRPRRIIISGGGTGGHVFPAIAIAKALQKIDPAIEVLFVGAEGKIEMETVPKAGFPIKGLWISGFQRKLTLRNLLFPIKLLSSLVKAFGIVRKFKPDVAVGVGGYASYPTVQVASWLGTPGLIQEQNSYAGMTNKMLKGTVDKVCVAYPNMERYFPKEKLIFTGNPVRQDLQSIAHKKEEALKHFGLQKDRPVIVLTGGSLGARTLNDAMAANHDLLKEAGEVQVLWQAGKLYIDEFESCDTAKLPNVKVLAFIDRMDLAYAMADLVICRAGALTISELCLTGKPTILIPSPNVAEDHQTKNAMALVEKEAAILVKDQEAKQEMLVQAMALLKDQAKMKAFSDQIRTLAKPTAAETIAKEILNLAG